MTDPTAGAGAPSRLIDARIRELSDWRGEPLVQAASSLNKAKARK